MRVPLLFCLVALTDEFWSGVAVVAAPDVEREQRIEHEGYAWLVFSLPLLGSALLEAGLALLADRYRRQRVTAVALLSMSAALVSCALATDGPWLAIALALAGASSGVACAAAQGELVAANPAAGARAMTRWVLFGSLGDVLTPLFVAVVLSAGGSYRSAFWAAALVAAAQGALLVGREPGAGGPARASSPGADTEASGAAERPLDDDPDAASTADADAAESEDPLLLDVELPDDGVYILQVEAPDTAFIDDDGDGFRDDPISLEESGLGELRTGDYELFSYAFTG